MVIKSKKFRDKRTGEIVERFPILDIANFEEVTEEKQCITCREEITKREDTLNNHECEDCAREE